MNSNESKTKILKIDEVTAITSLSRTTIWRLELNGDFPKRIKLSERAMGWLESDIYEWVQEQKTKYTGEV